MTEIRSLAGHRPDLFAQRAGLAMRCGESRLGADVYRQEGRPVRYGGSRRVADRRLGSCGACSRLASYGAA